jgi:ferredoxin
VGSAADVVIDADRCVGSGLCVGLSPAHFRLRADGVSETFDIEDADLDELIQVMGCCPTEAITVISNAAGDPGG